MDNSKQYRRALEIVGMLGKRRTIHNAINGLAVYATDPMLGDLVASLLLDFMSSTSNTEVWPLRDIGQTRDNASKLVRYCRTKLG